MENLKLSAMADVKAARLFSCTSSTVWGEFLNFENVHSKNLYVLVRVNFEELKSTNAAQKCSVA